VARRAASQAKALEDIKTMAAGGLVDFESFKNSPQNGKVYQYALDAAGGSEDNLRAIFAMNRPKDQLVGTPIRVGDHFVQAYQNPLTGKVSYDTVQVPGGLPVEYKTFQKIGDSKTGERLIAIPDGWDGDMSKVKIVASTNGVGDGTGTGAADPQKTQATIDLVKSALQTAKTLAGSSGRSGIRKSAESWFVGSTDYTNLVAQTNTLKTNVLTLIGDPTIKKFFGPQMSNADVTLMTSAGTTLNPELQGPDQMKTELVRLEDLINRMDKAVSGNARRSVNTGGNVIKAPDGTEVEIVD
jgi:hypothetical protein